MALFVLPRYYSDGGCRINVQLVVADRGSRDRPIYDAPSGYQFFLRDDIHDFMVDCGIDYEITLVYQQNDKQFPVFAITVDDKYLPLIKLRWCGDVRD